jgi:hypothetical protein
MERPHDIRFARWAAKRKLSVTVAEMALAQNATAGAEAPANFSKHLSGAELPLFRGVPRIPKFFAPSKLAPF